VAGFDFNTGSFGHSIRIGYLKTERTPLPALACARWMMLNRAALTLMLNDPYDLTSTGNIY
jgi:hypothetical protein